MEVVHQITIMYKYKEIYKRIKEKHGDTRYNIRGEDSENKLIRITFIIKETLIVITVIREQE